MRRDIIAFDDGYFPPTFKGSVGKTLLMGVLYHEGVTISKILWDTIVVDGLGVTDRIASMVNVLKIYSDNPVVILDGITYAGFDVADPDKIYSATKIPVISFIQYPLDLERIRSALIKHFSDYETRYQVIHRTYTKTVPLITPWRVVRFYAVGITRKEASSLLRELMIYSPVPEPLRIAHMVASYLSKYMLENGYLP